MFDLGWSEILVIAVVGILVVGPKDLPRLMKTIGEWVAKARRMASHFQSGVDEMIRQAELEDLRKDLNTIRKDLRAPVMDPRTTTTPPPDNLMVSLGDGAAPEPLPLPGPIEGPIAPPAPVAVADEPPVVPPKAANQ
jgi:sec-independent protein translocase protein TatB